MPRESFANKIKRAKRIVQLLQKHYPDARCSLDFDTVHQLMVATILSAQCTDERVNIVTKSLFKKYHKVADYAKATLEQLGKDIYTAGFYNSKAKAIKTSAEQLLDMHNGQVPRTLKELTKLRGVGRKTASCVLGAGYGLAEGIVVDTHVGRISRRLRLSREKDPVKLEKDLMGLIDQKHWIAFSHLLIFHGREICKARKPSCGACFLVELCPSREA